MKDTKKTKVKKSATTAPKAPKAAAKSAAKPAAKPVVKSAASKATLTPEERYRMIQEAAYYVAERHGFNGDSAYFWSLAEAEINAKLK